MLYDGAGRFLRQAEAAFGEGAVEHAHDRLNRGEAIIDELLATLDMDQGTISERLQAIYVYCKRCLIEARLERDVAKVRLVVRLMAELREAWAQVALGAALRGANARQGVLAGNLANIDTPGYVRKDVDFHGALSAALQAGDDPSGAGFAAADDTAAAVRADGNSVDVDAENSALA